MPINVSKILIIRFRQIGDAVLSTALCNTLKQTFPQAQIHFVLNKGIAPLFENHPSIDKIITFDKDENSNFAQGICADDILPKSEQKKHKMTTSQLYNLITPNAVWQQLQPIFDKYLK